MINKITVLALMMVTSLSVSAFTPDEKPIKDDGKKKATVKRDDTSKVILNTALLTINNDIEEDEEEVDSLLAFPSNDLYSSWDTSTIHPYSFVESFKQEEAIITLTEPTDCGFVLPFKGAVTSEFGWRHRRPHYGTDIDLETGDKVVAAFDGMVRIAKLNRSYGNVVIIRHNNGLETVYAHLSKITVESGQHIEAGQEIGLGGNTGHSFGSHLHFEMRYLGQAIDAEDFINFEQGILKKNDCVITKNDVINKYDLRALHNRHKKDLNFAHHSKNVKGKGKKGKAYKIRKGDTLAKIAKRNHTTIKALCKKNGIKAGKKLKAGQKIKV